MPSSKRSGGAPKRRCGWSCGVKPWTANCPGCDCWAVPPLVGWIASVVVFAVHAGAAPVAARVVMGAGWLLLLAALAAAFAAQARVSGRVTDKNQSIATGAAPLWLLIAGLAVTAFSLLL